MKAFKIFEPGRTGLTEEPDIQEIGNRDVLLKIMKVGFCGSDLNTYRGSNPNVSFPRIPGHEIAAVIEKKGNFVPDSYSIGDRVTVIPYTSCGVCAACLSGRPNACKDNQTMGVQREGAMVEYLCADYEKLITGLNHLSFDAIAIVEPLSVGFHAGRRAEARKGEFALVFGCGMVGLGAIARMTIAGAKVIAVDISDEKLSLAGEMGASFTINSQKQNLTEVVNRITGGHGPAVALEAIGLSETFLMSVELAAYGGRVVYVGYAKKSIEYDTKKFIHKELQIRGARNAERVDFEDVLDAVSQSRVPIEKLISQDVPLEKAGDLLNLWNENPGTVSKILISIGASGEK